MAQLINSHYLPVYQAYVLNKDVLRYSIIKAHYRPVFLLSPQGFSTRSDRCEILSEDFDNTLLRNKPSEKIPTRMNCY